MKTSEAKAHSWQCPRCGAPTTRDLAGTGFVRHKAKTTCTYGANERDPPRSPEWLAKGMQFFQSAIRTLLEVARVIVRLAKDLPQPVKVVLVFVVCLALLAAALRPFDLPLFVIASFGVVLFLVFGLAGLLFQAQAGTDRCPLAAIREDSRRLCCCGPVYYSSFFC
jgi:hypothetical protein